MRAIVYSGNMLRQFATLCGGDYQKAIVLNHLYHEAYEHTKGERNYIVTMNLNEWTEEFGLRENALHYYIVALSEGDGLISYDNIYSPDNDLEITGVACLPYLRDIDFRLTQIPVEEEKVKRHNKRAIELNSLGTLTIAQWITILNRFNWLCAYCAVGDYEVLEHIIPLTFPSSGTTRWNCVPACNSCNSSKGPYHPDRLPRNIKNKIGKRVESITTYLAHWKEQVEK